MIPLVLWVGLPLDHAGAAGTVPSLSRETDELVLTFPTGFAALHVLPTLAEADAAFAGLERTAATHWPPPGAGLPGERAIGDGEGIVLVRDRNAVLLVRDHDGHAAEVAKRLLDGLTSDPAVCAPLVREAADAAGVTVRWDSCGRRIGPR